MKLEEPSGDLEKSCPLVALCLALCWNKTIEMSLSPETTLVQILC